MPHISIISSSVRNGRNSHRVALYFRNYLNDNKLATSEILDLFDYNFPLFEERLQYQVSPSDGAKDFADKINASDGVIIVTPEYNGGYPASIKNGEKTIHKLKEGNAHLTTSRISTPIIAIPYPIFDIIPNFFYSKVAG